MTGFTFSILMAGIATTCVGLILEAIGRAYFSRYKADDTKELASVVGFRVAAIFGIVVGFIFASTAAHLFDAKKNVVEEARLMSTLYVLANSSPEIGNSSAVRKDILEYAKLSVRNMGDPEAAETSATATNQLLLGICRQMAPDAQESADILWVKSEYQRSCAKLIDARGKKRIGALETHISDAFWIFFAVSFGFLAILFGAFDARLINLAMTSLFYFASGVTAILIFAGSDPYREPGMISAKPLTHFIDRIEAAEKDR